MRSVALILLSLMTAPAWAAWVEILNTPASVFYLDPDAVTMDGNIRRAWVLENYPTEPGNEVMSTRYLYEFDCPRQRVRVTASSMHTQWFGKGKKTSSASIDGIWGAVDRNPTDQKIFASVCR